MGKLQQILRLIIRKILGVPCRSKITAYELENICSHDTRFYITVGKSGVLNIMPGGVEDPQTRAAGYSLAYLLSREIVDFDFEIQRQLKKLERMNVPRPTPHLDALLREAEEADQYSKYFDESIPGEELKDGDKKETN